LVLRNNFIAQFGSFETISGVALIWWKTIGFVMDEMTQATTTWAAKDLPARLLAVWVAKLLNSAPEDATIWSAQANYGWDALYQLYQLEAARSGHLAAVDIIPSAWVNAGSRKKYQSEKIHGHRNHSPGLQGQGLLKIPSAGENAARRIDVSEQLAGKRGRPVLSTDGNKGCILVQGVNRPLA
jgi:hypothetical protein